MSCNLNLQITNLIVSEKSVSDFFVCGHADPGVDGVTVQGRKHASPEHQYTLKLENNNDK